MNEIEKKLREILRPPQFMKDYTYNGGCSVCGFDPDKAVKIITSLIVEERINIIDECLILVGRTPMHSDSYKALSSEMSKLKALTNERTDNE